MKRWSSLALLLCLSLVLGQSAVLAKGGRGQGQGRGNQGSGPASAQNSHGNGSGVADRDFGTDRAREVGRGKKKGLYKDQYSIGDRRDHDRHHDSHKRDKVRAKRERDEKKDRD